MEIDTKLSRSRKDSETSNLRLKQEQEKAKNLLGALKTNGMYNNYDFKNILQFIGTFLLKNQTCPQQI